MQDTYEGTLGKGAGASEQPIREGVHFLVLGYRIVSRSPTSPVGSWYLFGDKPDASNGERSDGRAHIEPPVRFVRRDDPKRAVAPLWERDTKFGVNQDILLPHLSDFVDEYEYPQALSVYSLRRDKKVPFYHADADVDLADDPRLYLFGTGIAFVVIPVRQPRATVNQVKDRLFALRKPRLAARDQEGEAPIARRSLWDDVREKLLLSELDGEEYAVVYPWQLVNAPERQVRRKDSASDHRRTAPLVVSLLTTDRDLTKAEIELLREAPRGDGFELSEGDDRGRYTPATDERCAVGPGGVVWTRTSPKSVDSTRGDFLRQQVFLFVMVHHQLNQLIALCAACGELDLCDVHGSSSKITERAIDLRRALVNFYARYHFVRVSIEDRLERFYHHVASFLALDALRDEAEREIGAVHELVRVEAEQRRTIATGVFAFIFSPIGVVIGIWQKEVATEVWPRIYLLLSLVIGLGLGALLVPGDVRFLYERTFGLLRRRRNGSVPRRAAATEDGVVRPLH